MNSYIEEKRRIEVVAYHEAGHAVMALLNGQELYEAVVQSDGNGWIRRAGEQAFQEPPAADNAFLAVRFLLDLQSETQMLLAGPIAEAEFCNQRHDRIICGGQDFRSVLALWYCDPTEELRSKYAFPRLDLFIEETIETIIRRDVWQLIELLAENLMRRHRLCGFEMVSLLSSPNTSEQQISIFMKSNLFAPMMRSAHAWAS